MEKVTKVQHNNLLTFYINIHAATPRKNLFMEIYIIVVKLNFGDK